MSPTKHKYWVLKYFFRCLFIARFGVRNWIEVRLISAAQIHWSLSRTFTVRKTANNSHFQFEGLFILSICLKFHLSNDPLYIWPMNFFFFAGGISKFAHFFEPKTPPEFDMVVLWSGNVFWFDFVHLKFSRGLAACWPVIITFYRVELQIFINFCPLA